jgi:hypothetical protein
MTSEMGAAPPAPDPRIELSQNGGGQQLCVPERVEWSKLLPGDLIAGVIVQRGRATLTVSAVSGSMIAGEPLEPGSWWRITDLDRVSVVDRFVREVDPQVGTFVSLRYRGRGSNVGSGARMLVDVGWITPDAQAEQAEAPPWG